MTEDHPRGCGEHSPLTTPDQSYPGSSPRMRGALPLPAGPVYCRRIIPADAGSTAAVSRADTLHKDHPRGCGEHGA